jgi:PmbA protein
MSNLPKHINRAELKSTDHFSALLTEILAVARELGATDASTSVSQESGFSVNVRMGEVESVAFSEQQSIDVSVYIGQRKGSASSSDTSSAALKAMVHAAYDIAQVSAADPCFGLPDKALLTNQLPDLDLAHAWAITPAIAIERALAIERTALQADARITNSDGVSVSSSASHYAYANSNGFYGMVPSTRHSLSASFISQDPADVAKMQRDYAYTTARHPELLLSDTALAHLAVERATSRLGARRLKTQQSPVLFSSRVSSSLFSTFIQAISGNNLYRKNSFLLNQLGQMVFPGMLHIHEQPHLLRALGSSPFDDEGVLTRNNQFVQNGVLTQYVLGSYAARKLGLQTTANSGGVANLTIDPTAGDLAELLNTLHTGLLVTELMGSGVNILTGDYSRGASGFWVENGEIQYPVEEITIAGNLRDMYRGIVAVGRDINPEIATRCGSVLIDSMMIAGEG